MAPRERPIARRPPHRRGLRPAWNRAEEHQWFFNGYGPAAIHPVALSYYRFERIVQDVGEICDHLSGAAGATGSRKLMLQHFAAQFAPATWSTLPTPRIEHS